MRVSRGITQDAEFEELGRRGYEGNLNDRQYKLLGNMGLRGALTDRIGSSGISTYALAAVDNKLPPLVMDFKEEDYFSNNTIGSFAEVAEHSRAGNATMTGEYGPELVTNGGFSDGSTGWTVSGSDSTHYVTFANGTARYVSDTISPVLNLSQTVLEIGKTYEVVIKVLDYASGGLKTDSFGSSIAIPTSVGVHRFTGTASSTTLVVQRSTTNVDITIDNISVREIPKIQWAPHNLLTYSEDFSNAAWRSVSVSVSSSSSASPSRAVTADLVESTISSTGSVGVYQNASVKAGIKYTFSVWVKAGTVDKGYLQYTGSNEFLFFDLETQSASTSGSVFTSGSVTDAGNGWYLVKGNYTPASDNATARQYINLSDTFEARNVSIGDSFYIWGAHLYRSDLGGMVDNPDRGDSYVPTTTSARYLPRIGHHVYNGSQWVNEGLLHESESRTNLETESQDYSAFQILNVGSRDVDAVGPDGQTSATTVVSNSAGGTGNITIFSGDYTVSTSTAYTFSAFLKAGTLDWVALYTINFTTPATGATFFDLANGVVGTVGTGHTATIQDVGNGWYRCSITFTTDAADTSGQCRIYLADGDGDPIVPLDGSSSILVYGLQFEAGSTPSSYIPTNGSSSTRASETLTIPAANLPWPSPVVIGEELVTNGTFDTDTSGWSFSNATLSVVSDALRVTAVANGEAYAWQSFPTEVGKVYTASIETVTKAATANLYLKLSNVAPNNQSIAIVNISSIGQVTFTFVATGATTYLTTQCGGATLAGEYAEFDNISVKEINPLGLSIQMQGEIDYVDDGDNATATFVRWQAVSGQYIQKRLRTDSTRTGSSYALMNNGVATIGQDTNGAVADLSAGINVPFNTAARFGSTFLNVALDGVAASALSTPTALPDLENTDLQLGYDYMGTISLFRVWDVDIGDTGIEEATS